MSRVHIGLAAVILFEILILFIGCQGDKDNPLAPEVNEPGEDISHSDTSPDVELRNTGGVAPPPALWGLYEVGYNAEERTITSVPLRGPAFAFNVVSFLQPPMGSVSGVTVGILDDSTFLTTGKIDIRIILHHPFPGLPMYTGFDVCGIFMTEGTISSEYNTSLTYADPLVDPTLLNPDGYTRWMNPTEFLSGDILGYEPGFWGTSESSENSGFVAGATLNPYKYFGQTLGPDDDLHEWLDNPETIANRGIFLTGSSCARDYNLQFPTVDEQIVFIFNYAVLANWVEPDINPPEDPLVDFPPEANAGWPLHIWAIDNSNAYYTEEDAGGILSFDVEIFDWGASTNPAGIPGEVIKFIVWGNEPIVEGGYAEILSTEVEWNSGFTASTSVATIELTAAPEIGGDIPVWIEIQSANPSSYDQNFGAIVPDDPLAAYISIPVEVLTCPKAGAGEIQGGGAGSGDYLDDITITGNNFVDGPDLGVWLELVESGGSAGETSSYQIYATDVQFIDEATITADFNLANAFYGDYGLGCINGCGTITTPNENAQAWQLENMKIRIQTPLHVELTTNREGPSPEALDFVTVSWTPVLNANYYRIYAKVYDVNGNLVGAGSLIGTASYPQYTINLATLPNGANGTVEIWVTSLPGLDPGQVPYESNESAHTYAWMQNFEGGLGAWGLASESSSFRLIRSTVDCAYSGSWGLKEYGYTPSNPSTWALMACPPIWDVEGATTVYLEFLHRCKYINESNGYQVGWLYDLPLTGDPVVNNYYPISTVSYGRAYNDTGSPALQSEFGCLTTNDNNFQNDIDSWYGWYLSGFDVSEILGDDEVNYLTFAFASTDYDHPEICVDDIAILVY